MLSLLSKFILPPLAALLIGITGGQRLGATVLYPYQGGTGTNTAPVSGQVLIGNSLRTYTPAGLTAGSGVSIATSSGGITISATTSGDWTGTFDGQEGTYYLSRTNHTGTQAAATISDFTSTARSLFSGTSPISYNSGTGAFSLTQSAVDHGSIGGLTDDDHTQYALLAGRSGGQTLIGGTGSADDLTLQSTSHGTKGSIIFGTSAYDEVNNRLGIGTTAPSSRLQVVGTITLGDGVSSPRFFADYDDVAGSGSDFTGRMAGTQTLSFGFNSEAAFSGTIASSTGRQMYFFDRVASAYRLLLDGDGTWWYGTGPTNYNLKISAPSGSITGVAIDTSGRMGIGTSTPARSLHINDTMRLQPRASAPSSPASGDMYMDSTPAADELCVYDGAAWQGISSGTDANCT